MRESSKAALCGIVSALSVVIMLSTFISPFLVYTAPAFSGLLLLLVFNELGFKWSFATYVSISLLSLFIIADKESAIFFTFLFGYFPMLSCVINGKFSNRIPRLIIKLLICNLSCLLALVLCSNVLGIDTDDVFSEGKLYLIIFLALCNLFFIIYCILINRLQVLYIIKLQKKFRKLFKLDKKG